jgi:curli production assembly/transport component CsgG/holdfast attachment protein HfaB
MSVMLISPLLRHLKRSRFRLVCGMFILPLGLSSCAASIADINTVRNNKHEAPIVYSAPVRTNVTPMSDALACYGKKLKAAGKKPLGIAIGDVKDYTGKQGQDEGFAITQGGALMAYSALGKLGDAIRVHERFDTRIADAELVYMDHRQLGDGSYHSIPNNSGNTSVPWKPYYGGTVLQSDYFIVGGITELNYNIQSGGVELAVDQVGPKGRVYTMNIAVDLRIVGTQSLMVYDTVSVEKQLTGYEVGAGVFRFFGSKLFDVNMGMKNQEPLQLGVRTAIEAGVLQLIASVAGVDPTPCVPPELGPVKWNGASAAAARADVAANSPKMAEQVLPEAKDEVASSAGSSALLSYAPEGKAKVWSGPAGILGKAGRQDSDASAILDLASADASKRNLAADGGELAIVFAGSGSGLDSMSEATIEQAADLVHSGRHVNLVISGRSNAALPEEERKSLERDRIRAVVVALLRRGVGKGQASLLWQATPDKLLSGSIASADGLSGPREIARLRVG